MRKGDDNELVGEIEVVEKVEEKSDSQGNEGGGGGGGQTYLGANHRLMQTL